MPHDDLTPEEAIKEIGELIENLDENLPDSVWSSSGPFLESVRESATDMSAWIEENDKVTPKQIKAIRNWAAVIEKKMDD